MNNSDNTKNKINVTGSKKGIFKRKFIFIGIIILIIIGVIYEWHHFQFMFTHVSTSDAFIDGSSAIIPIAPQIKGKVVKVFVKDNEYVKKNTPLFKINQADYIEKVKKTKAAYEANTNALNQILFSIQVQKKFLLKTQYELDSDLATKNLNYENFLRYYNLVKSNAVSRLTYDEIKTRYMVSKAKVNADKATLEQIKASIKNLKAKWKTRKFIAKQSKAVYKLAVINLSRTIVYAPCNGYVTKKNVNVGSYVTPGIPYLSIVNLHKIWVVANFKEIDIYKIKIGAPVIIKVDAYPNSTFKGHVASFQAGTGSVFSLLPPENATGNFIKVVQRVPIKIALDKTYYPNTPLYPGLSVEPFVLIEHSNSKNNK